LETETNKILLFFKYKHKEVFNVRLERKYAVVVRKEGAEDGV
jgi:hypothetical protein